MLDSSPGCRPTAQQVNQQIAQLWAVEGGLPDVQMGGADSPPASSATCRPSEDALGMSMCRFAVGCLRLLLNLLAIALCIMKVNAGKRDEEGGGLMLCDGVGMQLSRVKNAP